MNLTTLNRTLALLRRLFDTGASTESIIQTAPQKPAAVLSDIECPLPRATPESQGISSNVIGDFVKALQADPTLEMHNLLILRHGKLLYQASFGGHDYRLWKNTYSECKSITSLAIGLLVDDGKLRVTDRVVELLEQEAPLGAKLKFKNLTVEHLLTMTSTVIFNEAGAMASEDWIKSFFNSSTMGELGKTFNYNSLNSYILSAIVKKVSGQGLSDFLEQRLFRPMGITGTFWEKCPRGIEKGGWGFYIRPEDMAKLGQLVMNKGLWNGKRLLSESWIQAAVSTHQTPPSEFGDYDYGYQIWVCRKANSFLFNGMLSQNVLGFPDNGILIVSNAGIAEMFQQSRYYEIARKFFSGPFGDRLPSDSSARKRLQPVGRTRWWAGLKNRSADIPPECKALVGKSFHVDFAPAAGLMPVFMQAVQNNYTKGTKGIAFLQEENLLILEYRETDEIHRIPIGFGAPVQSDLVFHGEPYRVAVSGKTARNEDDIPVLKVRIEFIETPCTRILKFYMDRARFLLLCLETPGTEFVMTGLQELAASMKDKPIIGSTLSKVDRDFVNYKIEKLFQPRLELQEDLARPFSPAD